MKVHDVNIEKKYFEPIRDGKISLLVFKTKVINDFITGDCIRASVGSYDVTAKILKTYMKAFEDVTEEEAAKTGFLTKDFLKEELINKYELKPLFSFELGQIIDKELFFFIEIEAKENSYKIDNTVRVNLYGEEGKSVYDLWRNHYDI